ncbi:MAG: coagulation factor 5/8 type domain-containing protein [Pseudomonadota bacterium]
MLKSKLKYVGPTALLCSFLAVGVTAANASTTTSNSKPLAVGISSAPGAPLIGAASAGKQRATVTFSAPTNIGSGITDYVATCSTPNYPAKSGGGIASPITVMGLLGGKSYSCTVVANSGASASPPSAAALVTPLKGGGITPVLGLLLDDDAAPDFGPNVKIYDSKSNIADIQTALSTTFTQQETNQFGTQRYAFMFKPGSYAVDANLGFYTHILGLGKHPDDVTINGDVHINVDWLGYGNSPNGNATQNFWRSAENLHVIPSGGAMNWAAAQAVPFRRMHVDGNMFLSPYWGWASGGYIADSKVGDVHAQSQQQWFTRNSDMSAFYNVLWNMVFVGTTGAPAETFPDPATTNIAQTPLIREKPFLYFENNAYRVFVPALRANSVGTSWSTGTTAGTSLPISQFYIVRSDNSSAAQINAALAQGKNLLFTPGVYHISDTIRITRAETVVLGIGLATIIPDNGVIAMSVADVDGVKIAGLLFDAGTVNSPTLLEVGPVGSTANHAANPSTLFDVFVRVGGTGDLGTAKVGVTVNSNNVIGDHFWIWRADHGDHVAWDLNTSDNGVVVNGNDVTMYGLFVEHFQKYDVLWNGNGGRTYFFQNEKAYDVPNQAVWMDGATKGYAAYKVADAVNTHEAWGMGSYSLFLSPTPPVCDHSYETPVKAGIKFHNIGTVFLGAGGEISHIINNTGPAANAGSYWQKLTTFPIPD